MAPRRLLPLLVVALLLGATGCAQERPGSGSVAPPAPGATASPASQRAEVRAEDVLHAWDVRRAAAWARGDLGALRRLYTPGSSAGRRDVRMLRSWTDRGLTVRGMHLQVLAIRVRRQRADRLVLVVTDRLAGGVAVGRGTRTALPRDAPTTRTLVLSRVGGWRVDSARAQASPVRRTASTSRSSNS